MIDIKSIFGCKNEESCQDESPKAMIHTYIFVDLDNTSWKDIGSNIVLNEHTQITFYADTQHAIMLKSNNMKNAINNCKAKINKIESKTGPNATDFKIVCDVALTLTNPGCESVYIISSDSGYDSVIEYLRERYSGQVKAIEKCHSMEECFADIRFMSSKTKDDLKSELLHRFNQEYRQNAVMDILQLI